MRVFVLAYLASVLIISFFLSHQQHLRKWMEVVVITHKGGQRSDGSVSIHARDESPSAHVTSAAKILQTRSFDTTHMSTYLS